MFMIFDVETSDMPNFRAAADDPCQPHIVQICGMLCDPINLLPEETLSAIIKPEGWTIAEGAMRAHGITMERAMDEGRPIAHVMEEFDTLCDAVTTLIAYNIRFDNKLVRGTRRRLGVPDRFGLYREFDPMKAATPIVSLPPTPAMMRAGRRGPKTPNLGETHKALLGRDFENAHDAQADVEATRLICLNLRDTWKVDIAGEFPKSQEERAAAAASSPAKAPPRPRDAKPAAANFDVDSTEIF